MKYNYMGVEVRLKNLKYNIPPRIIKWFNKLIKK